MSVNFSHLDAMLFILISISVFMVSSRPIVSDPEDHVATTPSPKTLVLKSSDGDKFEVHFQVALQSETIRQMIVDGGFSDEIELSFPNITGEIMAKVLEYCNKHVYYAGAANNITAMNEMRAFDTQFVNVHYKTLFKLVLAANDLKLKNLLDLVSGRIGDIMKGKGQEEIRRMFNIKQGSCTNHLTKEEYVQGNSWAFDLTRKPEKQQRKNSNLVLPLPLLLPVVHPAIDRRKATQNPPRRPRLVEEEDQKPKTTEHTKMPLIDVLDSFDVCRLY